MRKIATRDAVGQVLCHDITRIVKGKAKDVAFRKEHVVRAEDVRTLHSLGKFHLYVWENQEGMLHENEGAEILREICQNTGVTHTPPKEGKIELFAAHDGLFRMDVGRLAAINGIGGICVSARHSNTPVRAGEKLAGARVVPLVIAREKMEEAKRLAGGRPLFELLPYKALRAGIVVTGSEVAGGLIQDAFTPVVEEKLAEFGIPVTGRRVAGDCKQAIANAITKLRESGAGLIVCTGGMSVDPDDLTPGAIAQSGARVVRYGAPVLPGNMFLLAYFADGTPVIGLPGCVMYARRTIFDLILPRIAAGVAVDENDFAAMGNGGLCLDCPDCRYPNCAFGKGC